MGWVQSGNITRAGLDQAEVLDNFIPTAQGARLRGGSIEYADIGASVVRMFDYSSGGVTDLFAATANSIFDADRIAGGGSNTWGDVEGLTSGDWSATQISTTGGQFVVIANGSDYVMYWDGADWNPIADVAISDLGFDAETAAFTVGETVTGGTSGATATVLAVVKTSATAGTLRLGAITGGPYQDNEALTGGSTGAATADGASAAGTTVTISGVTTSALSYVWRFKERLFFVEGSTPDVWYMPVDSIGGTAKKIALGSVFRKGGSVLFGSTWSTDSGSGMDDLCVFVSDQGEVAIYEGSDPSSASTWYLVGVYDIGRPLNKHGHFRSGGDLAIMTSDGIVPLSQSVNKDRAATRVEAITYPIEDAWRDAVSNATVSYPVSSTLWQSKTLLLIGTPDKIGGLNVSYIANARTGAWSRVTGWDVRCALVSSDVLYFGNNVGKVMKADQGGNDDGAQYTAYYVPKFASSEIVSSVNAVGITYRAVEQATLSMTAHQDYTVETMPAPLPTVAYTGSTWGTGVWGTFVWGDSSDLNSYTEWQSAYAYGYSFAPGLAITSNQASAIPFEILSMRARVEAGYPI